MTGELFSDDIRLFGHLVIRMMTDHTEFTLKKNFIFAKVVGATCVIKCKFDKQIAMKGFFGKKQVNFLFVRLQINFALQFSFLK